MPPPSDHSSLHLIVHPNDFFVVQLKHNEIDGDVLINLTSQPERFFSLTRTAEEVSVVGEIHKDLSQRYYKNSGWRCIRIAGPMEFNLTGVLASFTLPLQKAQVPVFAVSTWNTDYVLVPKDKLEVAVGELKEDGWTFIS
ncbi:ACT domain-containing protein [Desarmillaria ectypa]|nr:ACT domain-containing protein [Desarmillaria ectypa]